MDHFTKRARNFSSLPWFRDAALNTWLAEHLAWFGSSVIDFGAGTGLMADYYAASFDTVHLLEPNVAMLEELQRNGLPPNVFAHRATLEQSAKLGLECDVAVAKSSFHHFSRVDDAVELMALSAKRLVAIVEVVAPSERCVDFAFEVLRRKEQGRSRDRIFTSRKVVEHLSLHTCAQRVLIFDQYIDIGLWLENSPLSREEKEEIVMLIAEQKGRLMDDLHIHHVKGRLRMLRRIGLHLGFLIPMS